MTDPEFMQWWERAKLYDEFRGCTMPAAYAAWLAGKANAETGVPVSPTVAKEVAAQQPAPAKEPAPKRVGKYRGDKGGEEKEQVGASTQN